MLTANDRAALRFVARHLAMGLGAGALFGTAILVSDFAGLRSLAFASEAPWLVTALLFFGLFITFGSVSVAANLMLMGHTGETAGRDNEER